MKNQTSSSWLRSFSDKKTEESFTSVMLTSQRCLHIHTTSSKRALLNTVANWSNYFHVNRIRSTIFNLRQGMRGFHCFHIHYLRPTTLLAVSDDQGQSSARRARLIMRRVTKWMSELLQWISKMLQALCTNANFKFSSVRISQCNLLNQYSVSERRFDHL